MFVYGDGSLCLNLAGIDPEKLYRGTFICKDASTVYVVASYGPRFFSTVL